METGYWFIQIHLPAHAPQKFKRLHGKFSGWTQYDSAASNLTPSTSPWQRAKKNHAAFLTVFVFIGFLILLWGLRRFAWGPVLGMLETRRQKIAGEFDLAAKKQAEADALKGRYEQELRGIDALSRQKIQDAIAEGQKVAGEIKEQAGKDAADRLVRAADEIMREREKAKEVLKEQVIQLSLRGAEKILRQKLDDPAHRKLVSEFIDEVGALR